jgi:hypothetical protein
MPRTQRIAPFLTAWCATEPGRNGRDSLVMRGLDPRTYPLQKNLAKKMDGRVKPGHDGPVFGTVPALRSGMKNAAPRPGHGIHPINRSHGSTITSRPTK